MYQVDVWAGDLHQNHVGVFRAFNWAAVEEFMEANVDAGLLCNVLHTDFKAPPEKVEKMNNALLALLST